MVCFRYIIVNTLHTGDNKDDDDYMIMMMMIMGGLGAFVCAVQDQVVNTKNYRKFIIKDGTMDDVCRRCN